MGALDVMPVVYLDESQRGAACAEVLAAAGRIGAELDVPVILYGELATRPEHEERAWLRQGGWRRLAERIESGEVVPDFGPARAHPTAGVVLAAARPPLVAFNLDLEGGDLELAKAVAAEIRESNGGLPGVRAIGLYLEERELLPGVDQRARLPGHAAARWSWRRCARTRGGGGGGAGGAGARGGVPAVPGRRADPRLLARAAPAGERVTLNLLLMAQTKNKRKRKHRGTPAGTIERAGRTGSSRTRTDAKQIARERRAERLNREPTWRGSVNRAAIAAAVFGVLVVVLFGRDPAQRRRPRGVHVRALHPARLPDRPGDLQLPAAPAQVG